MATIFVIVNIQDVKYNRRMYLEYAEKLNFVSLPLIPPLLLLSYHYYHYNTVIITTT
jgi:hypothetical protein